MLLMFSVVFNFLMILVIGIVVLYYTYNNKNNGSTELYEI